ncbi:hypothetical protein BD289DRAFT_287152 [Coniella lustricola]|uniref:Uncharacterized protein n=1 Tax=Coniella lustricola TaxID=2025994 RepID=A0A2T3A0V5_9PEZI|nr:hypothetical protein BD289DRAFT_59454 [Coniella lustricola]PSR83372.1 hypothetical protein BD289DRAFT_287152 [Coniella lustricola]
MAIHTYRLPRSPPPHWLRQQWRHAQLQRTDAVDRSSFSIAVISTTPKRCAMRWQVRSVRAAAALRLRCRLGPRLSWQGGGETSLVLCGGDVAMTPTDTCLTSLLLSPCPPYSLLSFSRCLWFCFCSSGHVRIPTRPCRYDYIVLSRVRRRALIQP